MKYVILALLLIGGLAALAWSVIEVETEEEFFGHVGSFREDPPSLDEQILQSDVIVKATFVSATASSESFNSRSGTIHLPVQKLRFRSQ